MRTKKVAKRVFTIMMVMTLILAASMTAFAATGNVTRKASSKMTIILDPRETGNFTLVSITVSGLPADAVITRMTVDTGAMTYNGAVLCNYMTVSSSNGRTEQVAWTGQANQTLETSRFLASPANGTYTLSFNATNMSSLNLGTKTYQPSITIYWDDEF